MPSERSVLCPDTIDKRTRKKRFLLSDEEIAQIMNTILEFSRGDLLIERRPLASIPVDIVAIRKDYHLQNGATALISSNIDDGGIRQQKERKVQWVLGGGTPGQRVYLNEELLSDILPVFDNTKVNAIISRTFTLDLECDRDHQKTPHYRLYLYAPPTSAIPR